MSNQYDLIWKLVLLCASLVLIPASLWLLLMGVQANNATATVIFAVTSFIVPFGLGFWVRDWLEDKHTDRQTKVKQVEGSNVLNDLQLQLGYLGQQAKVQLDIARMQNMQNTGIQKQLGFVFPKMLESPNEPSTGFQYSDDLMVELD